MMDVTSIEPKQLNIGTLWAKYHEGRKEGNGILYRNLLIEHYRHLIKHIGKRLHQKLPKHIELDDLISAGNFGLMEAIESFDPGRGVKFETYCAPRISGSMLDELRYTDWAPKIVRTKARRLKRATKSLEVELGRTPTNEETAEELNLNMKEFYILKRDAKTTTITSLNQSYGQKGGDNTPQIDFIKRNYSNPLYEAQKKDFKEFLTKGLTRAEKLIIILYYYGGMSQKEIGQTINLSESRVSQKRSLIMARLKGIITRKGHNLETLMPSL